MGTRDEETRRFFKHSSVQILLCPRSAGKRHSWVKQQVPFWWPHKITPPSYLGCALMVTIRSRKQGLYSLTIRRRWSWMLTRATIKGGSLLLSEALIYAEGDTTHQDILCFILSRHFTRRTITTQTLRWISFLTYMCQPYAMVRIDYAPPCNETALLFKDLELVAIS
jgi:hypothetical protein